MRRLLSILGMVMASELEASVTKYERARQEHEKTLAAHQHLRGEFAKSEATVEKLRVALMDAKFLLASLEPRRLEAAEGESKANRERERREFLADTIVRGKRWGDMSEKQQQEFLSLDTESALRTSLLEMTGRVALLEAEANKKSPTKSRGAKRKAASV